MRKHSIISTGEAIVLVGHRLPDLLAPDLRVIFVGTAAGKRSAELALLRRPRQPLLAHPPRDRADADMLQACGVPRPARARHGPHRYVEARVGHGPSGHKARVRP